MTGEPRGFSRVTAGFSKVHLVKAMVFPVVMYGHESWTVKKAERQRIDAFELWCWRRLLSCVTKSVADTAFLLSPGISCKQLLPILGVVILVLFSSACGRPVFPRLSNNAMQHRSCCPVSYPGTIDLVGKVIFPVMDVCFPNQIYAQLLFIWLLV